jgi:hypothetical protein
MSKSREEQLIENIRSGKYSEQELISLYNNAEKLNATTIMEEVKIRMRIDFPRAANRMFGARQNVANAILEEIFNKLATSYDFTGNRVENRVKTGGEVMAGKKHIDAYISYKNDKGFAAFLGLIQDDPASELKARVIYYKTGKDAFQEEQVFQMHDIEQAVAAYKTLLSKVLAGG